MSHPLSRGFQPATSSKQTSYGRFSLTAEWAEQAVTVVAVSTAVLIVAIVAVCMGMA
jgi:hypothetical protein